MRVLPRRAGRVSTRAGSRRGRRLSPRAGSSIAPTDPGLTLLQSATLWLSAANPGSDPQKLQNLGTGGSVLDARLGSTSGVDTNDPLLLTHTGTNYLYLPGSQNDYAQAPDSAALDLTGDIEIIAYVTATDWTPAVNARIVSKIDSTVATGGGYEFYVSTSGQLIFQFSNGSSYQTLGGPTPSYTDGTGRWLRASYNNTTKVATFSDSTQAPTTAIGSITWNTLASSSAGSGSPTVNARNLRIGMLPDNTVGFWTGSIYRVWISSVIGATSNPVFDANFTTNTNQSSFTESSSNAATVTINRSTSGRKSVMVVRPTLLFGTDDYLEVADNDLLDFAASDSFTAIVVQRAWNTIPALASWMAKRTTSGASGVGWGFYSNGATLDVLALVADGTTASTDVTGATWSAGDRNIIGMIRDVAADEVQSVLNSTISAGTTDGTTGTLNGAVVFRVGRDTAAASPGAYLDGEIEHVVLFRSALTSTELGQIATYLGVS